MRKFFLACALLVISAGDVNSGDIYSMIKNGDIDAARDSLSKLSTAAQRNGNYLFYLSLVERHAQKSVELMEAAQKAGVSAIYREEIEYRLAQFMILSGNTRKASKITTNYLTQHEGGKRRPQFMRYSALIDEQEKRYEAAIRQIDRFLLQYDSDNLQTLGQIDKARIMMSHRKTIAARVLLRKLSSKKSGEGVAPALYYLTLDATNRKRTDDAVFFYNLLKEGYPASIGLDALLDNMSGLSSYSQREKIADQRTGTYYSVQLGVFADRKNAERFSKKFKKYGHKVEIKSKYISGRTYRVVFVGRFNSYEAAAIFEQKLEAEHKEVFQVIAR